MKIKKLGRVWLNGKAHFKSFAEFREIRKGKDAGKVEILIQATPARKLIVPKSAIKYFPIYEEEKDERDMVFP